MSSRAVADAAISGRSYTTGSFAFVLGGNPPAYVRSVKGGTMVADAVPEAARVVYSSGSARARRGSIRWCSR